MPDFKEIRSRDNSLIKLVSRLQSSSSARRENGLFVLEGLRLCSDAFINGIRFDKLIVSFSAAEKYNNEISEFLSKTGECIKVPDNLFEKISDTKSPQGIIALCRIPEHNARGISSAGRYVALENIVARTAEALGADGLIVSSDGCDPYSPKVLRSSMGTVLRLPVFVAEDFELILKSSGLKTYACVVDSSAESITVQKFSDGCAVLIGNEANGLTEKTVMTAYRRVTIPMKGKAESLNAAAAAAIAVWEMMK